MPAIIKQAIAFKLTITKGCLLTFIAMGNLLVATMHNWDSGYVSSLRWWDWLQLTVSVLVCGANSIYTFIDKTFHIESEKNNAIPTVTLSPDSATK